MFDRSAELYDAFYEQAGKDYWRESTVLLSYAPAGARSLLDLACGTGRHLAHFSAELECAGVDLDAGLLAIAQARCPDVRFEVADMVEMDLGRRFDVVTCLFSAIGYVGTDARLHAAVARMEAHLEPGGVLLVEPWFAPEQWWDGHTSMLTIDRDDLRAVRVSWAGRRGDVALLDFQYLVATADGIDHRTEHHELMLFTDEHYRAAFEAAGLRAELRQPGPAGRGLWVGTAVSDLQRRSAATG
jgi:ubiquinone/menaquinone biosynthesis C-methylase UbiE